MQPFDFGKHVAKFIKTARNPWDRTADISPQAMPGMPRVGYNTRTYQKELQPPPPTRRTAAPAAPAWQTTMHSNAGSRGGMPSAQPSYDFSSGAGPVEMADGGYVSPTRGPESTPSTDLVLNSPSGASPASRPLVPNIIRSPSLSTLSTASKNKINSTMPGGVAANTGPAGGQRGGGVYAPMPEIATQPDSPAEALQPQPVTRRDRSSRGPVVRQRRPSEKGQAQRAVQRSLAATPPDLSVTRAAPSDAAAPAAGLATGDAPIRFPMR